MSTDAATQKAIVADLNEANGMMQVNTLNADWIDLGTQLHSGSILPG